MFHLAAQSLVRKAYSDPLPTYRANVMGTLAVLEACRRNGVGALVVATTDKVYRNDESGRRYAEDDELGGADPYSASKSCAELMVRSYRREPRCAMDGCGSPPCARAMSSAAATGPRTAWSPTSCAPLSAASRHRSATPHRPGRGSMCSTCSPAI